MILEGIPGKCLFQHDLKKLAERTHYTAGQLVAWSIGQGGPGLPVIAEEVYKLMTGQDVFLSDKDVHLITDFEYLGRVEEVKPYSL